MSSLTPSMPKSWQWLLRITGAVALLLFLTPTFYVIKYYALDLPRETALALPDRLLWVNDQYNPDDLLAEADAARHNPDWKYRILAVQAMGETLRQRGVSWKRPLEGLSAKATLAELAVKDPRPEVRALAGEELARVAQGGAIIRR